MKIPREFLYLNELKFSYKDSHLNKVHQGENKYDSPL